MTKYIIVVGGVISGVGKGVTTASIAKILMEYGFKVTTIKIDPYINYDAGTLRPTEHGEVWVTDDGGEIDQDLGNYERFLGKDLPKKNNITTGQIYHKVIDNERKGKYLGETVQFIPHIPEEVKRRILEVSKDNDFVVIEIGGTIGDFENIPFLFAVKSLERDIGKQDVLYFLITYVLIPRHTKEMKTKPTQQAIRLLSESGIFPDFILCRAPVPLDKVRKGKIETYANIASDYVISEPDIDTIYRVPLDLEKEELGKKILKKCNLQPKTEPKWSKWSQLVEKIANPSKKIKVAVVGKYVDIGDFTLTDSYISINESLKHAGAHNDVGIEIVWIDSKTLEKDKKYVAEALKDIDGILIPGGFGSSGIEGKINAIRYARENGVPFLGLCYGLQLALVEFARNVCDMENANTVEVDKDTKYPIVSIQEAQKDLMKKKDYGGTMRLGAYAAILKKDTTVYKLYKETGRIDLDRIRLEKLGQDEKESFRLGKVNEDDIVILERHRHRFEVNPEFIDRLCDKGMVFSGYHERKDGTKLMEFIELENHPFFVGTQGHPEFKSRLTEPAPLFYGFVRACKNR